MLRADPTVPSATARSMAMKPGSGFCRRGAAAARARPLTLLRGGRPRLALATPSMPSAVDGVGVSSAISSLSKASASTAPSGQMGGGGGGGESARLPSVATRGNEKDSLSPRRTGMACSRSRTVHSTAA